jgi:hypothetical protein
MKILLKTAVRIREGHKAAITWPPGVYDDQSQKIPHEILQKLRTGTAVEVVESDHIRDLRAKLDVANDEVERKKLFSALHRATSEPDRFIQVER